MASKLDKPIDVPFSRGVRQDLEGRMAPLGSLASAYNIEFDKLGNLIRRDGFTACGMTKLSKTNTYSSPAKRFATGAAGELLAFADDNAWTYVPSKDKACEAGIQGFPSVMRASLTGTTTGAKYLASDQAGAVPYADCGYVSPWLVVAYVQRNTSGTYSCYCDITDMVTGARAVTAALLAAEVNSAVQPRVIVTGGTLAWVFYPGSGSAGALKTIGVTRIDLSAATITDPTGTGTSIVTDANSGAQVFDVAPSQGGFAFVYSFNNGVGGIFPKARLYTTAAPPVQTATFDWLTAAGAAGWTASTLSVRGAGSASEAAQFAGFNPATSLTELLQLEDDWTGNVQGSFVSAAATQHQLAMVRVSSTKTLLAYSDYSSTTANEPRGTIWFVYLDYNVLGPVVSANASYLFAGYSIGSKFYVDSDSNVYSVGRFNDWSGFQSHLLLLDWGNGSALGKPVPVASFANGRVPLLAVNSDTGIGGIADLGSGKFAVACAMNIGASSLSGQQVGVWTWESAGNKRFLSTLANGGLIVGGGAPLIYDGQRLVELSFFSYPVLGATSYALSGAAGSIADGTYQYRFVWEWNDATGNRHQSPASPSLTIAVTGGRVTFSIVPLHATRKQVTRATQAAVVTESQAPVRLVMYRTAVGGNVFFRHSTSGVNSTATAAYISIYDGLSDALVLPGGLSSNEQLYVQQSKLSSSAPPPTVQPITHLRRLWGVDSERPERIWCTKSFEDGEAPGYNPALQITIPGAGTINGLAGQDGRLYGLATNGIYLASYGDGPTNTGQGAFPEPSLITITANCIEPRSVLTGQEGIYFAGTSRWGTTIYQIKRGDGNPVDIGIRVRDELQACPVVRGAIDRPAKNRVEVLCVDSDAAPTIARILYYHYDVLDEMGLGQWTVAKYVDGRALYCLGSWGEASVVSEISTPRISIQTAGATQDVGTSWAVQIDTCDMRPFGILGYGEIDGVVLMVTKAASSSLIVSASYDSGLTYGAADTFTWSTAADTAGGPAFRRWEMSIKKVPTGSIRFRLQDAAGTGLSSIWHGLSIEATPLGGNARLPAAQMG